MSQSNSLLSSTRAPGEASENLRRLSLLDPRMQRMELLRRWKALSIFSLLSNLFTGTTSSNNIHSINQNTAKTIPETTRHYG